MADKFQDLFTPNTQERKTDIKQILDALYSTSGLRQKTILTKEQAYHLARLSLYAKIFKSENAQALVDFLSEYQISTKDGQGRKDAVTMVASAIATANRDPSGEPVRRKIFGIF